ncbi:MAG: succinylglutamate desuccinylase [Calditrichaeota bacterium]|nr:MAG: succinylglutamate desuccinylase [Calditrichota bacterium]
MSKEKFILLGKEIEMGESAHLELEVAKLHTRHSIHIPIFVERAKKDGPVLLLMGGVHGDEVNGVGILREIIKQKLNKPKIGTTICIPVLNVFGYLSQTREFPDGRDLNRVFPGSANGSLASQFAYKFTQEIVPLVDYTIDFHSGGGERDNFPQIRCAFGSEFGDNKNEELAEAFGAPIVLESKCIPKSVRYTMEKAGKPIILFEGGKSKNLDKKVIETGVRGALNVMKFLGMQKGEIKKANETFIIKKSKWLRAPFSGMFHLVAENGTWVPKRTLLGIISDPYGEFERKVLAPTDCFIICVNKTAIVNRGDALFHIGTEFKS